jgi:DNA-binding XRE family transcriptional regulator
MKSNLDSSKLRQMRKDAGLSQWQVALSVGKTQGWLSNIELGYVTPSQDVALEITTVINALNSRLKSTND